MNTPTIQSVNDQISKEFSDTPQLMSLSQATRNSEITDDIDELINQWITEVCNDAELLQATLVTARDTEFDYIAECNAQLVAAYHAGECTVDVARNLASAHCRVLTNIGRRQLQDGETLTQFGYA